VAGLAAAIVLGAGAATAKEQEPADPSGPGASRKALELQQRQEAAWAAPAAVEQRHRSRTAFADLRGQGTVDLAREHFGGATSSGVFRVARAGDRIVRRLGEQAAVIEHHDGTRGVVQSSAPVTVRADGQHRPVDLSLHAEGDDFVPESSTTPIRISRSLGRGIELGDAGLRLRVADGADASALLREDRVFWPDADVDSDVFVTPVPGGVETFVQVRSVDSPEMFTFDLDLPAGATVRRAVSANPIPNDPPEAMQIVLDGQVLATVYPPLTADADGRLVPTEFSVDADGIHLAVDHRERDVRYPLLVDPTVISQGSYSGGWPGWRHRHNIPDNQYSISHHIGAAMNDPAYAAGLYLSLPRNNVYYGWEKGWWQYETPNQMNVYRAEFGNIAHFPYGSYAEQGIANPGPYGWQQPVNFNNQYGNVGPNPFLGTFAYSGIIHNFCYYEPRCLRYGQDQNLAIFTLAPLGEKYLETHGNMARATMGWANIYLGDRHAPALREAPGNRGWRDDGGAVQPAAVTVADLGSGVASATLSGAATGNGTLSTGCNGGINVPIPCQPNGTHRFTGFGYTLREGVNTLTLSATDVIGNPSAAHTWTEKIDRTAPNAPTLSGTLWSGRNAPITDTSGTLVVNATDGPAGANSGMASATVKWDGQVAGTKAFACRGADNCSGQLSFDFSELTAAAPARAADGTHTLEVVVADLLGHVRSTQWTITIDRNPPSGLAYDPRFLPTWQEGSRRVTMTATDAGAGVRSISLTAAGREPQTANASCASSGAKPCPTTFTAPPFDYVLPDGENVQVRTEATDALGRSLADTWRLRSDSTPPDIRFENGLDPLAPGTSVDIHVTDGTDTDPRSGVQFVVIKVDGAEVARHDMTCDVRTATFEPSGQYTQCPQRFDTSYTLSPSAYSEGPHTIEVVAPDLVGNIASESRTVYVVGTNTVDRSKLGLENYFGYESFPTGADTAAHVNVANRNTVWHSIPVSNPGRGLSTAVNLTYNSLDHGGYIGSLIRDGGTPLSGTTIDDLAGIAYGEAGIGFSLGISSLTRLNEPLSGVGVGDTPIVSPGTIRLTDVDGTRHTFQRDAARPDWYREPPGVQLALRRDPYAPADRRWIATRPDGVAFFFDSLGYQTYVRDRNGNEIRFEYEKYSKVTGKPSPECAVETPPLELLCTPRVVRVVDAAGVAAEPVVPPPGAARHPAVERRSVVIQYYDNPVLPIGSGSSLLSPALIGPVGGAPGRIKRIVDHGGRATDFAYDAEGYLTSLAQGEVVAGPDRPGSTADRRVFGLRYSGSGQNRQLTGIVDPRRGTTGLTYATPADPGATGALSAGMPTTSLRTRRGGVTTFTPEGGRLKVTAPGPRDTFHTIDGLGRPTRFDDAVGASDRFAWDGDNNLARIERGATATPGAVTTIAYDRHGNPVTVTDPRQKVTSYSYMYGTETGIRTHGGIDDGQQYVANLQRIDRPGNNDVELGFDWTTGNVTSRRFSGYEAATTDYDQFGQVTREIDEEGNQTGYEQHDENGLPQLVIDGRGKAGDPDTTGRWLYRYDAVGNVLTTTDPRGTVPQPGAPFTTSLTYDAFDRVVAEQHPKRSEAGEWITRRHRYDPNGNPISSIDGNGEESTWTYTATDQVQEARSPATTHAGELAPTPEVTRYLYDLRENVVRETSPNGSRTTTVDDFTTQLIYDLDDRLETYRRMSRGGDQPNADLMTTYRYDARDNVIRVADPRTNANGRLRGNLDTSPRWTFAYDAADNRTDAIEGQGTAARHTRYVYDDLNHVVQEIAPKGMAGGAPNADATKYAATYAYDSRDQVIDTTRGGERRTVVKRRGDGLVSEVVSPRGTATADPDDFTTRYAYDENGDVESITLPRAPGQYGPIARITYRRNAVGDPVAIWDPRNNARPAADRIPVRNAFFDTGHLRNTSRPSLWAFEPGSGAELHERDYGEWPTYRGGKAQLPASEGHGDFGAVGGQGLPDLMPRAGLTWFTYDGEMRLQGIRDAAGNSTWMARDPMGRITCVERPFDGNGPGAGISPCADSSLPASRDRADIVTQRQFDHNGNLRTAIDPLGHATSTEYDQFDRWLRRSMPGSADDAETADDEASYGPDVVEATWDPNGNQLTAKDAKGAVTSMTYTAFDQLESMRDPEGGVTTYGYDQHGNRSCELRPRGNDGTAKPCVMGPHATTWTHNRHDQVARIDRQAGDQVLTGTYEYDENGNQVKAVEPGAGLKPGDSAVSFLTERTFDGRDLPWTVKRGSSQGGEDQPAPSTTVREFDPNGNLRRVVNPKGVEDGKPREKDETQDGEPAATAGQHATVFELDADNLLTDRWLPRGDLDERDGFKYRQHFERGERGQVIWIDAPYKDETDRTVRVSYAHYKNLWILKSSDEHWVDPDSDKREIDFSFEYDYDRRGSQKLWQLVKPDGDDEGSEPDRLRRTEREYYPSGTLKRRLAKRTPADDTPRSYVYGYDANRQLKQAKDVQRPDRIWNMGYDLAGRMTSVNESWSTGKDTKLDYDADGNVRARFTDGRLDAGADDGYRAGKATRFTLDSLARETEMRVLSSGADSPRVTETSYWPSGRRKTRTKPNDTVERWSYDNQNRLVRRERDPASADTRTQLYSYDRNGNRTRDERGTHAYNSRDQHVKWERENGTTVAYEHNAAGALIEKQDGDTTTTFKVRGNRLRSATASVADVSASAYFRYDRAGNMYCSGSSVDRSESPADDECVGGTRYRFDDFNRMVGSKGEDAEDDDISYVYDALDRRDLKCVNGSNADCTGGKRRNYAYVGLSDKLSLEQEDDGKTRTYDYDSAMQRVGQERVGGTERKYRAYALDANGSVVGLEADDGQIACQDTYNYDPYGQQIESECGSSAEADANPFRFEGFHFDPQAGSYDMQAREYRPDVGRFTSLDLFESASGDLTLQGDPLTQDRYAFAAGNPVNNVEFDGHEPATSYDRDARQVMRDKDGDCFRDCEPPPDPARSNSGPDPYYQRGNPDAEDVSGYATGPASSSDFQGQANWHAEPTAYACQACPSPAAIAERQAEAARNAEKAHDALDKLGQVPYAGEAFDGLNGLLYLGEGDVGNAAISFGGMAPHVGSLGTGARIATRNADNVADATDSAADAARTAKGTTRTVTMGRNMGERVIPYAEKHGYDWYRGTPGWVPRKTLERISPATLQRTDLWFNKRWIRREMRRESDIVDIGEPAGYPRSPFYEMERREVSGYPSYRQDPQP
jgi:RHS repeat-associated protein